MVFFGVFHLKTPTYTSNGCIYTRSTKYDISMEQFSKNNLEKNVTENKPLKITGKKKLTRKVPGN
jgi:hypothetical protein